MVEFMYHQPEATPPFPFEAAGWSSKLFWTTSLLLCLLPLTSAAQSSADRQVEQHFLAAKEAAKAGHYERAADEYQAALKLAPTVPELYNDLGLVYYLSGKNTQAIGAFEQALKLKPDLLGANLFLGMAYLRINEYEKSLAPLKKAISLDPKLRQAYLNLSVSYSELGRYEDALEVLQQAAKLFPNDVEVLYSLGKLYTRLMTDTFKKIRMRRFCTILWGTCSGKRDNLPRRKRNSKKSCKFRPKIIWRHGNWGISISRTGSMLRP